MNESDTYALALAWIENAMRSRGKRIDRITLTRRDFVYAGEMWRCGNGPWKATLLEAISAYRNKEAFRPEPGK